MPNIPAQPEISPGVLRAVGQVHHSQQVQALLERTLGRALLAKLQGHPADLVETYQGLGGADPVVLEVLQGANARFQTLPVQKGIDTVRKTTLSPKVGSAAGKKSVSLKGNVLTQVEGTAVHTLAVLGGPEFAKKYNLHGV